MSAPQPQLQLQGVPRPTWPAWVPAAGEACRRAGRWGTASPMQGRTLLESSARSHHRPSRQADPPARMGLAMAMVCRARSHPRLQMALAAHPHPPWPCAMRHFTGGCGTCTSSTAKASTCVYRCVYRWRCARACPACTHAHMHTCTRALMLVGSQVCGCACLDHGTWHLAWWHDGMGGLRRLPAYRHGTHGTQYSPMYAIQPHGTRTHPHPAIVRLWINLNNF